MLSVVNQSVYSVDMMRCPGSPPGHFYLPGNDSPSLERSLTCELSTMHAAQPERPAERPVLQMPA